MLPLPPLDIPSFLRPMKAVEEADMLMQHAHALYKQHEYIMTPIDRTLAEDKITYATDLRHGVEEKSWLAQTEQAGLYSGGAHEALETVKRFAGDAVEIRGRKDDLHAPVLPSVLQDRWEGLVWAW